MLVRRCTTLAFAALLAASAVSAQTAQKSAALQWGAPPPFLPAGAKFALVSGDPGKPGPFEIRLDMPDGYVIPPHWHPTDETVTVKFRGTTLLPRLKGEAKVRRAGRRGTAGRAGSRRRAR